MSSKISKKTSQNADVKKIVNKINKSISKTKEDLKKIIDIDTKKFKH